VLLQAPGVFPSTWIGSSPSRGPPGCRLALARGRESDRQKTPRYRRRPSTARSPVETGGAVRGVAGPDVPEKLPTSATISNHWRMSHGLRAPAGLTADPYAVPVAMPRRTGGRMARRDDHWCRRLRAPSAAIARPPARARAGCEHAGSPLTARRHHKGCAHPAGTGRGPAAVARRAGPGQAQRGPRAGSCARGTPTQPNYGTPGQASLRGAPGAAGPRGPRLPGPRWRTG
jgi:hypothetical protein